MGGSSKNKFLAKDLDVETLIVSSSVTFSLSTGTTSITFVTGLGIVSSGSSYVTYTKQTMYISGGVIRNFSTVTSTLVTTT